MDTLSDPTIDKTVTMLVVDDEPINRLGLRILLETTPGFSVIGEAANGQQAIEMAERLTPDVILMDLNMPVLGGISAAQSILSKNANIKIVMLTSSMDESNALEAVHKGINGYCLKDSSPEKLQLAVRAVQKGDLWLDSSIASRIRDRLQPFAPASVSRKTADQTQQYESISTIEHQILSRLIDGCQAEEIAKQLNLTPETLRSMEAELMNKIAVLESHKLRSARSSHGQDDTILPVMVCDECDTLFHSGMVICPYDGTKLRATLPDRLIGSTFVDRYEIISRLGKGAGATVYKARHKFLNKTVAIKIIHTQHMKDLSMVQRFRCEAEIIGRLSHPNLIAVYDFGLSPDGLAYMIMDYIEGRSLASLLDSTRKRRLELDRFIEIFVQVCDGLQYAHWQGLVHRDLKPTNIMIRTDGVRKESVKIVDFGVAKPVRRSDRHPSFTNPGEVTGSPTYMSPEQCRGLLLEPTSDIYSLGCTMYECLTGRPPFIADSIPEVMYNHIKVEPTPPSRSICASERLLIRIDNILLKTLAKDPNRRYQSAADLRQDLFALGLML